MRKAAAVVAAVILLAACSAVSAPTSPVPLAPSGTPEVQHQCEAVSLRAPDGEIVFLTGRWIGSGDPNAVRRPSVFLIRQSNNCIVWVGLSAEDGESLGESWIETFSGTLRPDFTVVGLWDELPDGGRGAITVELVFVPVGGGFQVELLLRDSTGNIHGIKRWVREDPSN